MWSCASVLLDGIGEDMCLFQAEAFRQYADEGNALGNDEEIKWKELDSEWPQAVQLPVHLLC